MEKQKIDNNLVLVDDIMNAITQTDEWQEAATSIAEPAIMYGIHVAFALQDVTGRIPDFSRHIMQRTGGVAE